MCCILNIKGGNVSFTLSSGYKLPVTLAGCNDLENTICLDRFVLIVVPYEQCLLWFGCCSHSSYEATLFIDCTGK